MTGPRPSVAVEPHDFSRGRSQEEVGRNAALIGTVEGVEVTDGSLSIHTETRVDNTSICGVGVWPPGADHPS